MATHHSQIGTAAWLDLLRQLKDGPGSDLRGTPKMRKIGGRSYWYDHFRIGSEVVDRYIGEDSEELRARLDRVREIGEARKTGERERARLMRILRAEGYLMSDAGTGQIITAMERSGVFRLGGTLVGTQAFRHYEGELGVRIEFSHSAVTDDIDISGFKRLSIALGDTVNENLVDAFSTLKFEPFQSLEKNKVWRWRQTDRSTVVQFLMPSREEDEGLRDLPALGVSVQSLHYLDYLIAEPIQVPLLYRSGALVRIPRPERFAIHKLITAADRRRADPDELNVRADRAQAAFLVEVLSEERPEVLIEAYEAAREKGPQWRARLDATLGRMPGTRARLEALR